MVKGDIREVGNRQIREILTSWGLECYNQLDFNNVLSATQRKKPGDEKLFLQSSER